MSLQFLLTAAADAGLDVSFGPVRRYKVSQGRYYARARRLIGTDSVCCHYGNRVSTLLETTIRDALEKVGAIEKASCFCGGGTCDLTDDRCVRRTGREPERSL